MYGRPAIPNAMDNKTEIFLEYRSLLFSIAYHMLGNIDAAEDIVQDTYLRWMDASTDAVRHTKAFLVKIITNQCINYLNSARVKREQYIGVWLPEPLPDHEPDREQVRIESWHALSIGMLMLMERLTPQERALFLLKEVFSYDYNELAELFNKTADNCRQIVRRAKDHLGKDARRYEVDMKVHEKMLNNFLKAVSEGNMDGLIRLLKEDVRLFADGGGKTFMVEGHRMTAFQRPIEGSENVSRAIMNVFPRFRASQPDFNTRFTFVNGLPCVVSRSGDEILGLIALESDGEQIRNIFIQSNPDKLKHIKQAL